MQILVCLKQTFDTEEKVVIENGKIKEDGVEFVINPYDEYAVEEAIRLRDRFGGEVTVVSIGPDRAESALRTALAMGADKAVLINDPALDGGDEVTISKVLAAVAKRTGFDIILCGNMAVDDGSAQVGARVAELLDIPQLTTIVKLEIDNGRVRAERDVEGDVEVVETTLPVLVTCQQGLNEPRYPSLPGIMKAKKKPLERLMLADLGLDPAQLAPKTAVVEQYLPPKKQGGRILQGELADQVKELVHLLRTEAKVI